MKTKLTLIPLIAIAATALTTVPAAARGESQLVRLAHNIEAIASELQLEFRTHYAHSGAYRHLMSDASLVLSEARHIDSLSHDPYASLRHIQADLVDLDKLAHHLHALVDAVDRGAYPGHVDGDTRRVHGLLDSLTGSIHQMGAVVAAYAAPVHHDDHSHHDHYDPRTERSRGVSSILESIIRGRLGR